MELGIHGVHLCGLEFFKVHPFSWGCDDELVRVLHSNIVCTQSEPDWSVVGAADWHGGKACLSHLVFGVHCAVNLAFDPGIKVWNE